MAADATASFTKMLAQAGVSPDGYGAEMYLIAANEAVMRPMVPTMEVGRGDSLYLPVVPTRTARQRTRATDTTPSDGTEGNTITFDVLNDSKETFTKRFSYNALKLPWEAINDVPPEQLATWMEAEKHQMGLALANDFDAALLGSYASAANVVGAVGTAFSYANLAVCCRTIRVANGRTQIYAVLPETEGDTIATEAALSQFQYTGMPGSGVRTAWNGPMNSQVVMTNNVVVSTAARGLVFAKGQIVATVRTSITFKMWEDGDTFSDKIAALMDWAYAIPNAGAQLVDYSLPAS